MGRRDRVGMLDMLRSIHLIFFVRTRKTTGREREMEQKYMENRKEKNAGSESGSRELCLNEGRRVCCEGVGVWDGMAMQSVLDGSPNPIFSKAVHQRWVRATRMGRCNPRYHPIIDLRDMGDRPGTH